MYDDDEPRAPVPLGVWAFHALWICAVIIWIVARLLADDKYVYVQTVVLALTLIAIVWYTYETRRMQQAVTEQISLAVRQTNLSIQPVFTVHVGESQTELHNRRHLDRLELENIGNGVALNIQIDIIFLNLSYSVPTLLPDPHIIFERIVVIEKGARVPVEHTIWANKEHTEGSNITESLDLMRELSPPRAEKDYEMKVRFSDIIGNRYVQTIHIGKIGSWPDIVEFDTSAVTERTPAYYFRHSPFTAGPLKYLKWKRLPLKRRF